MFNNLPNKATLIEVGPRDGFQFEERTIPTDLKVEIIGGLVEAGLKHVQVTSFVHPARVPQMADAEDLLSRLPERERVIFSGLVLNVKGVERAHQAGLRHLEISISASDTHSRKNSGMTLAQAIEKGAEMIKLAKKYNMIVRAGIQCAFGCVYEGKIPDIRVMELAQEFIKSGIDALALSDTTGMAKPLQVKRILGKLLPQTKDIPVILHLHDTRGLGLVNVMAALECGITHFDTTLAGMGGCPFVAGAAGNIATEDTAYLLEALSIETGVNISKITRCAKQLETFFGKQFSGKIHRVL